jgi:hypothetical protein
MRCRIRPRMTAIGAPCALRHDQKFVSRTPASVGLHLFHFPQRLADELAEIARQPTGTIDRQDRGGHSSSRLELLRDMTSSRRLVRCAAIVSAPGGVRRGKASLRRRRHAARKFFPRARRVRRIPSPGAGREGIGLSSRSLIARRYRHRPRLLSSPLSAPALAVEFAGH